MVRAAPLLLAALLFVGIARASNAPYPIAGCWERATTKNGQADWAVCIQYFGFQNIESLEAVVVPPGFDNYLLVNERPQRIPLPTTFPGQTQRTRVVNVTLPCTRPGTHDETPSIVQWVLNGHVAVSSIGQAEHYCGSEFLTKPETRHHHGKSKKKTPATVAPISWDDAHAMHETHPYRAEQDLDCVQVSLSEHINGGCARLPLLDPDTLHSVKVLDIQLSTQPSGCSWSGSAPLSLGLTLSAGCRAAPLTHRDMFSMSAPCALSDAWFGLDWSVERPWPTMAAGDLLPDTGLAYRPVAQRDEMSAALRQALIAVEQDHGAQDSMFVRLYASGEEVKGIVRAATLRVCSRVGVRHVGVSARSDAAGRLEPLFDCTSRIDTTQCVSHFGYHLYGSSEQHRPISAANTFAEPPYDRGQPVRFHPGEHHNVFSVVWNCSDTANQALPAIAWQADGTATANRRMPLCRIGCDGSSDGSKHYDTCGVCGGDGSSCRHSPRAADADAERAFCDGDNERSYRNDFEGRLLANVPFRALRVEAWNVTISSDKAPLMLVDSSAPPAGRVDLGTPNNHHAGGVGVGVGGSDSNSEALGLVLAFESPASAAASCMRFDFDRPSYVRGVQLLNIPTFCADLSVMAGPGDSDTLHEVSEGSPLAGLGGCASNADCLNAVCVSGVCVKMEFARGGGGTVEAFNWNPKCDRCRHSSDCEDGRPCTADVCVSGICHHPVDEYCCEQDEDCQRPQNPCEEAYCALDQNRCHVRPVEGPCEPCSGSESPSRTPAITVSSSPRSATSSGTPSPSASAPSTGSVSTSRVPSQTSTATPSVTRSPSVTSSVTATGGATTTPSNSGTPSRSGTSSSTATPSVTTSSSITPTVSPTGTSFGSLTPTITPDPMISPSSTATQTPSLTASSTLTPSSMATPSLTETPSNTITPSSSATPSRTATQTITVTPSATASQSQTPIPTATASPSQTATSSAMATPSQTATATPSVTPTPSVTASASLTGSKTPTRTATSTPTSTPSSSRVGNNCTCARTQGYWKTHPQLWDQSLSICGSTYASIWALQGQVSSTPWVQLALQWQAADLNARANFNSSLCVNATIQQLIADGRTMLERYCQNRTIPAGSENNAAVSIAASLATYNWAGCDVSTATATYSLDTELALIYSFLTISVNSQAKRCGFGADCEQRDAPSYARAARSLPIGDSWDSSVRSWVALFDANGGRLQRQPVPMSAADNGVSYVRFSDAPVASSMEVCMCSGRGAVAQLDYDYPGSGLLLDGCGRCNGTGTSCAYLPTDMVQPSRVATNPVVIREVDADSYRVCYIHRRTPADSENFDGVAVRVGFSEPHVCGLRVAGSCDSSLPVPVTNGQYCDMFGGPEAYLSPSWRYEPLSRECVRAALDEDDLLDCPTSDASASGGYRLCTTLSFADLSRCAGPTGAAALVSRDNSYNNGITHSGHVHAAEFRPLNCMSESSCEMVEHVAHRSFSLQTTVATATQFSLATAEYEFHADVTSVSSLANGALRVSLQTSVEHQDQRVQGEPTTRVLSATVGGVHVEGVNDNDLLYVITPGNTEVQLDSEHGGLRLMASTLATECTNSEHQCTQQWTLVLFTRQNMQRLEGEFRVGFDVAVRGVSVDPAVVTLHLYVNRAEAQPIGADASETQALNARSAREASVADSMLTLFRDAERTVPYTPSTPEGAVFIEGRHVYAHLAVVIPEAVAQHAHAPTDIELTDVVLCYSVSNANPYIPFDPAEPGSTGCASPGEWITVSLFRHGQITSAGQRVGLNVSINDADPLTVDFDWSARAATRHPVYIDARWRLLWQHSESRSVTAEDMASVRLAQHRSDALHNGRKAYDWKEELSVFHTILTARQMEETRHNPAKNSVRMAMAARNAQVAGMDAHELTRLLLANAKPGARVPNSDLPALRTEGLDLARALNSPDDAVLLAVVRDDAAVYPAFNDETWEGGAQNAILVACNASWFPHETAEPPVEEYCDNDCDDCGHHGGGGFIVIPCYGWWGCGGDGDHDHDHDWWGYHGHHSGQWWWILIVGLAALLLCLPFHGQYLPTLDDQPRSRLASTNVTNVQVKGRNNTAVVNTSATAAQRRSTRTVRFGDV